MEVSKQKIFSGLFYLGLLLVFPVYSNAQLNAQFTSNITQGCNPILVNFQDQSSGNINDYTWRLGNGGTSDSVNPSVSYNDPGKYTVTLIVSNGNNVDSITKTNYITVFENPATGFKASPKKGCKPLTVNFTDQSQKGDAPITSRTWDFGDGGSSSNQNPQHTYLQSGKFKVTLFVKDQNGCSDLKSKNNYINVDKKPDADFSSNTNSSCRPPLRVYFDNKTTGKKPISYTWKFGDGSTSNVKSPSHRYQQSGKYDVTLIVSDANGCKDTIVKKDFVRIQNFTGKWSINKTQGCISPITDTFQFKDLSSPTGTFRKWSFGDGVTSSAKNPTKIYDQKGIYPVRLITGFSGCKDTFRDTIRVQQVEAGIKADSLFSCELPFTVNFNNHSTRDSNVKWWFGDGTTSNKENPSHTYSTEDSFIVRLMAENKLGCQDTAYKGVFIKKPEAAISINPLVGKGCIGRTFGFSDTNKKLNRVTTSPEPIVDQTWAFGDNSFSDSSDPAHIYKDTGKFIVSHSIKTKSGCTDTAKDRVLVGDTPSMQFSVDTHTFCGGSKVEFDTAYGIADSIMYYYGTTRPKKNQPEYEYDDTVGWFYPFAIPYHKGCKGDTAFLSDSIYINPPIAKFKSSLDCDSPLFRKYVNFSIGYDKSVWDIETVGKTQKDTPTVKFPKRGRYQVKLSVSNDSTGCRDSLMNSELITKPEARFSMSDSISCPPLNNVKFDAGAAEGGPPRRYYWNFKNGVILDKTKTDDTSQLISPPPQNYKRAGDYEVVFVVTDKNFCRDSAFKTIQVYQHNTQIDANPEAGCLPLTVNFSDNTKADTTITNWQWDFDNGTTSTKKAPKRTFNNVRDYTVRLKTKDAQGCKDTGRKVIKVGNPNVYFTAKNTDVCRGEKIEFLPNTSPPEDSLTLIWQFGDGDTSYAKKPEHKYEKNGDFDVKLIGIENGACADTFERQQFVNIESPVADFSMSDTNDQCPPLDVEFRDSSKGKNLRYEWLFGDGSRSLITSPRHLYTEPDTYQVRLSLKGESGCTDTLYDTVSLGGPRAKFNIQPDSGCKPLKYRFFAYDKKGVTSTQWDVGKGVTKFGDTVTHSYEEGGLFYPSLIIKNDKDCKYSIPTRDTVRVDTLKPIIDPGKSDYCIYEDVQLKNPSKGTITDWHWTLRSPPREDSTKIPDFTFDSIRKYHLKLVTTNYRGCKDSTKDSFSIHPKPEVFGSGGGFICEGEKIQLAATEDPDFSYSWRPARGLEKPNNRNPLAGPDSTTYYRVRVSDENNCLDTSGRVEVTVQRKPRLRALPDTTIVKGDSVKLRSIVQTEVKGYQWSPKDSLSCVNCPSPFARPFNDQAYTLKVEDTSGCFVEKDDALIKVDRRFKIVLPEAFTPNGDGVNDKIYVKGWGIESLLTFRIYNRWGELVYESNDIDEGWDGRYKGEVQNMGTYSYYVKARSYEGEISTKKGTFNLLH